MSEHTVLDACNAGTDHDHRDRFIRQRETILRTARERGDLAALAIMRQNTSGIVPMNRAYAPQRNARPEVH